MLIEGLLQLAEDGECTGCKRNRMRIQLGDTVFGATGKPAVVLDREPVAGQLTVDDQGSSYEKTRRIGFINGMSPDLRQRFESIVTRIRQEGDHSKRVSELTAVIDELNQDPRNLHLVRYLESEKAHIMHTHRLTPRNYTMSEDKV